MAIDEVEVNFNGAGSKQVSWLKWISGRGFTGVGIIRSMLLLVLIMLATCPAFAANIDQFDGFKEYSGAIDGNLNITMLLERHGQQLEGEYYYDSQRMWLTLKGEMVGPDTFVLKEFDRGKNTGIFSGTIFTDGRIAGQWSSPAGNTVHPFQLAEENSSIWTGRWSRTGNYFNPATLKIWNVNETGFDFQLSAASGANMGMIGFFSQGPQRAQFTDRTAVYESQEGTLTFCLQGDKVIIEQTGNLGAGLGVVYFGEYRKEEAVLIPPTLTEQGIFRTLAEEEMFKTLVGNEYSTFLKSFQIISKEKDLDQIGASVYCGGVRGQFTLMEGIIMTTPSGEMWAAIIAGNKVEYFTNSNRIDGLPLTIENWRLRFKDREVIMVNGGVK